MSICTLIIIFGGCILLGITSVILEKKKNLKAKEKVDNFLSYVKTYCTDYTSQQTKTEAKAYILKNYETISNDIVNETIYNNPIYEFGTELSYCKPIDTTTYDRINNKIIEYYGSFQREKERLTKHFYNPFLLLYRGVEFLMNLIFGYFITKYKPEFNKGMGWKIFNIIITILGSITSILSYFKN